MINTSPLNSLLYRKKLNNALRNKRPEKFFANNNEELPLPAFLRPSSRTKAEAELLVSAEREGDGAPTPGVGCSQRLTSPSDTNSSSCASLSLSTGPPNALAASPREQRQQNGSPNANGHCFSCQLLKGKLGLADNRNRFLEGKVTSLESKIGRMESRIATLDSNTRRYETEGKVLREQNENLQRKLMECQEKALLFLQRGIGDVAATQKFLTEILQTTYLG